MLVKHSTELLARLLSYVGQGVQRPVRCDVGNRLAPQSSS